MCKFNKEKYSDLLEKIEILIDKGLCSKEITKTLCISKSTLFRICAKNNLSIPNYHNLLKFDNTVFDKIDTEEKAYWLGFLYADGSIHSTSNIVSLSLAIKDIDHMKKFNSFLKNKKDIIVFNSKCNGKEYASVKVSVCNKHFKERLIQLGCLPCKSLLLSFPSIDIFENKELVYDFIRGYIDGDGCITFTKSGRMEISILGTEDMLNGIKRYFPDKFKSIRKIKNRKNDIFVISNCCDKADYVANKLYKNATIYLDRKYNRIAVLSRNI